MKLRSARSKPPIAPAAGAGPSIGGDLPAESRESPSKSAVFCAVIVALGTVTAAGAQIGARARDISPEIVREMARQAELEHRKGLTAPEIEEFKSLHDADARIMRDIAALLERHRALERIVDTLDIAIDPHKLVRLDELAESVKRLDEAHQRDERAKAEDRQQAAASAANRDRKIEKIYFLAIGTLLSSLTAAASAYLKWKYWDPDRRKKDGIALDSHRAKIEELVRKEMAAVLERVNAAGCSADRAAAIAARWLGPPPNEPTQAARRNA